MSIRSRVLLIDDSSTIRRVVTTTLREQGFHVVAADSGASGLNEVRAATPDLIVLDYTMPTMNGREFLEQLAHEKPKPMPPVILLAARNEPIPRAALHALGVVDIMTKPFAADAIVAVVAHWLQRVSTGSISIPRDLGGASSAAAARDSAPTDPDGVAIPKPAEAQFTEVTRLLADALVARGVQNADAVAAGVWDDLRRGIASDRLRQLAGQPQTALSGDLSAVPLPEVLQLLKFQGQTGVLDVTVDLGINETMAGTPTRFEVAIKDGVVVAVRALDARADLLLGSYFVGAGHVSRTRLEELVRVRSDAPLGKRLIDEGLLTADQLRRCIGAQAQDLVVELLRARRGFFALRRGEEALPATQLSPGFAIDGLLFEALRRIDEWSVIEQEVTGFDVPFVLVSDDVNDLMPEELEILSVFRTGDRRTVRDVMRATSQPAFDVCRIIYRLAVLNRVRRSSVTLPPSLIEESGQFPVAPLRAGLATAGKTSK